MTFTPSTRFRRMTIGYDLTGVLDQVGRDGTWFQPDYARIDIARDDQGAWFIECVEVTGPRRLVSGLLSPVSRAHRRWYYRTDLPEWVGAVVDAALAEAGGSS